MMDWFCNSNCFIRLGVVFLTFSLWLEGLGSCWWRGVLLGVSKNQADVYVKDLWAYCCLDIINTVITKYHTYNKLDDNNQVEIGFFFSSFFPWGDENKIGWLKINKTKYRKNCYTMHWTTMIKCCALSQMCCFPDPILLFFGTIVFVRMIK